MDIGHPFHDQGDRLNVCHTELATFGLLICADGFAEGRMRTRSLWVGEHSRHEAAGVWHMCHWLCQDPNTGGARGTQLQSGSLTMR